MSDGLRSKVEEQLNAVWYGGDRSILSKALRPLSALYKTGMRLSQPDAQDVYRSPLPVIVVGNIVVGGAGKTPLVIALCELLNQAGYRPAVLSRGYRAGKEQFPHMVAERDSAKDVGDEPKLLHSRLQIPVCIDPERSRGARYLLAHNLCDVIVLDDGLQHRKLARDLEIAVIDGNRLLGNGLCLPAGPLREPPSRLKEVDFVVMNGEPNAETFDRAGIEYDAVMMLEVDGLVNLNSGELISIPDFLSRGMAKTPLALCGIANPKRFFQTLNQEGLEYIPRAFSDHHEFGYDDLRAAPGQAVIMTEKDAVKCRAFTMEAPSRSLQPDNIWYLKVSAALPMDLQTQLLRQLEQAIELRQ